MVALVLVVALLGAVTAEAQTRRGRMAPVYQPVVWGIDLSGHGISGVVDLIESPDPYANPSWIPGEQVQPLELVETVTTGRRLSGWARTGLVFAAVTYGDGVTGRMYFCAEDTPYTAGWGCDARDWMATAIAHLSLHGVPNVWASFLPVLTGWGCQTYTVVGLGHVAQAAHSYRADHPSWVALRMESGVQIRTCHDMTTIVQGMHGVGPLRGQ